MKWARVILFLTTFSLLNPFCASAILAAPKIQFSIVYTNDVLGEVEPCG